MWDQRNRCHYVDEVMGDCLESKYKSFDYCRRHLTRISEDRRQERGNRNACYNIYQHSKELKNDPERLTDDFIQEMVGVKCERLEKDKNKFMITSDIDTKYNTACVFEDIITFTGGEESLFTHVVIY